jgi:hypothetical protein
VPRIKLPNVISKNNKSTKSPKSQLYRSPSRESPRLKSCRNIPTFVDYDEYDAQVFKVASSPPNTTVNNSSVQIYIQLMID